MPVKLPQSSRLQSDEGGSNRLADGEVGGVDFSELTPVPRDLFGWVFKCAIHKGAISRQIFFRANSHILVGNRCVENVWVGGRQFLKDGGFNTKVPSQDVARSVC